MRQKLKISLPRILLLIYSIILRFLNKLTSIELMKVTIYIGLIAFVLALRIDAQNYIGLHKDEIISMMDETQRDFRLNTGVINNTYNYLKYEDKVNEQTLLFFLDEDDCCTYVRLMSDYANLRDVLDSLDSNYSRHSEDKWTYRDQGETYMVSLKKEDWFFTVNTKKEEK